MSTEYVIFNNEGCVEGGFFSPEEAQEAIARRYSDEGEDDGEDDGDRLKVKEICHDHSEQARETCEECAAEDEESEIAVEDDQ